MTSLIVKKYSKARVLSDKPVLIGIVAGIKFYEHPRKGDESPLIADDGVGNFGLTDFWEVPTIEELGYIVCRN
jgi:hypothetical protein